MAGKSIYTKELGAAVASQAKGAAYPKYHVIATMEDKWAVVPAGKFDPIKTFGTQKLAIDFAINKAKVQEGSVVVVHDEFGGVAAKIAC